MQGQWKTVFVWLGHQYNTYDPPKADKLGKDTITVSRLASCFPFVVCWFMAKGIGKAYIDVTFLNRATGYEIPPFLLTNMFAGLVPKEPIGEIMMPFVRVYHYFLDTVLHNKKPKSMDKVKKEAETYSNAARSSSFISDEARVFYLIKLGVLKTKDTLDDVFKSIFETGSLIWGDITTASDKNSLNVALKARIKAGNPIPVAKAYELDVYSIVGNDVKNILTTLISDRYVFPFDGIRSSVNCIRAIKRIEAMDDNFEKIKVLLELASLGESLICMMMISCFYTQASYTAAFEACDKFKPTLT
ncbi:unnamed protein product [Phaedon cochleariae]|uniref:Uncharacterized protein n=1 Tax=Phaedon cochleariae TaxID=80249 RepID=A0A9P0DEV7_PHACE|nr:unnamed protein product [Phaedon cochleariae]